MCVNAKVDLVDDDDDVVPVVVVVCLYPVVS